MFIRLTIHWALIPIFAVWFHLIPSIQETSVKHLNLITLRLHCTKSKRILKSNSLDINVVLQYSIYICEYREEGQPSYMVPLSSNIVSAISAQLVEKEENHSWLCTCIEVNCGEQIKVTESFHVCASLRRILRLQDFN
jgi:hypothetical protein